MFHVGIVPFALLMDALDTLLHCDFIVQDKVNVIERKSQATKGCPAHLCPAAYVNYLEAPL